MARLIGKPRSERPYRYHCASSVLFLAVSISFAVNGQTSVSLPDFELKPGAEKTHEVSLGKQQLARHPMLVIGAYLFFSSGHGGTAPSLGLEINGHPIGGQYAPVGKPDRFTSPNHRNRGPHAFFNEKKEAWTLVYDNDIVPASRTNTYYSPEIKDYLFRFPVADLWKEGVNTVRVKNLNPRHPVRVLSEKSHALKAKEASSGRPPVKTMNRPWKLEELGYANQAVSYDNNIAVLGPGADGKGKFFYTSYYRSHGYAEILGYDRVSKKRVRVRSGSKGLYGLLLAKDGTVYAGGINGGNLYALKPGSAKLLNLGDPGQGVSYIWDLIEAPDGKIYGGCYAGAKLLRYDPATGKFDIAAILDKKRKYLRYLAAASDGKLWCALNSPGMLVVHNPRTGSTRQVLPKQYVKASSWMGDVYIKNGKVFALVWAGIKKADRSLLVFDAASGKFENGVPSSGRLVRGDYEDGAYLYDEEAFALLRWDTKAGRLKNVLKGHHLGRCKWIDGQRYVHGTLDQDYYCFDLKTKTFLDRTRLTPDGLPGMQVYSMTAGPDGNIYGGVYINQHLWKVEAKTGKVIELGQHRIGAGQIDRITSGGGKVWCGSYTKAHIAAYDPGKSWNILPGPDQNPKDYGSSGMYRVECIVHGPRGNVYMKGKSSYSLGFTGTVIFDPQSGKYGRAPFNASTMTAGKTHLFVVNGKEFLVYDPVSGKVVHKQSRAISAVAALSDGRVLCSGGRAFFFFDSKKMTFTERFTATGVGNADTLIASRDPRYAYGISKARVIRISLDKPGVEVIHGKGGRFLAEDRFGNVYFSRGAELFRLVPNG